MDYTKNYHLPQWVKSDRIMMDDFNQMSRDLENGLNANAAATNALSSRISAAQSAANAAQSAANNAKSAADAAQATANTARQEAAALPYVVGSYTGTGSAQSVRLGFRPSFLIISGSVPVSGDFKYGMDFLAVTGGNSVSSKVQLTSTGFAVNPPTAEYGLPNLTMSKRVYDYIAFK